MQGSLAKFIATQTLNHALRTLESYPRVHKNCGQTLAFTKWLRLGGTSGDHIMQPSCSELGQLGQVSYCPVEFWLTPVMKTLQTLWAICSSVWSPWAFFMLNNPSFQPLLVCQMLQSFNHLHGPLLDLLWYAHVSCIQRSPEPDTALQMWSHQFWVKGNNHIARSAGYHLPMAAKVLLDTFATRAHCWLMQSLVPTRTRRPFTAKLLPGWLSHNLYRWTELRWAAEFIWEPFFPQPQALAWVLANTFQQYFGLQCLKMCMY